MTGKKRIFTRVPAVLIALLLMLSLCVPAGALPAPAPSSESVILMDAATGQVLFEKRSETKMYPASLVTIMTALLASEADGAQNLSVRRDALSPLEGSGYRVMNLKSGETITVEDALCAMLLISANDAAYVLADGLGGDAGISGFVDRMNAKALELGMHATTFKNPSGMHDSAQQTTAHDLALLLKAALASPAFSDYFGRYRHTLKPTALNPQEKDIRTSNKMHNVSDVQYEGSTGGKLGNTTPSGYTLVQTAERNGRQLIAVVLKGEREDAVYSDAKALLDFGFGGFAEFVVKASDYSEDGGAKLQTIMVREGGATGTIVGTASFSLSDMTILLNEEYDPAKVNISLKNIPAYLEKGSAINDYFADIYYDGGTASSVLMENVPLTIDVDVSDSPSTPSPDGSVTGPGGESVTTPAPGAARGPFARFILTFFKVLGIIVLVIIGLIVLLVAGLYVYKKIRRYRRRKRRQSQMTKRYNNYK